MKTKILITCMVCLLMGSVSITARAQIAQTVKKYKVHLNNYRYDNCVSTIFSAENVRQVEFTAYNDILYRVVFCSPDKDSNIEVNVYENRNGKKGKRIATGITGKEQSYFTFEPSAAGNYFIEYTAISPAVSNENKKNHVVMIVGSNDGFSLAMADPAGNKK